MVMRKAGAGTGYLGPRPTRDALKPPSRYAPHAVRHTLQIISSPSCSGRRPETTSEQSRRPPLCTLKGLRLPAESGVSCHSHRTIDVVPSGRFSCTEIHG